jgi:EAL domain-containing protein (putative c-di-GMP-specific phosphodiesterase class I)
MASFTYLRELPVNYVKIDGNFISRIVTDPVSAVMVESVVRVAHAMNVKTVAEFVENDAVLRKLLDLNIDFAQGYFLHRPELLGHNS